MADLRISELPALSGANLAAGDLLPIADISASETKKITVVDLVGNATTLIADATIPGAKILFSSGQIAGTAIAAGGIGATQLADDAITPAKLADESTVDLVTTLPGSGAFVGQLALDTDDNKVYCWNGSSWLSFKAAGSVNTIVGDTAGIVNLAIATSGDQVTITTSLDNTAAAAQFLAGPTASAGAVAYRVIAPGDLPTATTTTKGAVSVNGQGLTLSGDQVVINNAVTPSGTNHLVTYDAQGLVTGGAAITSDDLPTATSGNIGGVRPGTGLSMGAGGALDHTNVVSPSTGLKLSYDGEGHVTGTNPVLVTDLPDLPASKITSGTLSVGLIGTNSLTGTKLSDASTVKFGGSGSTSGVVTFPTADFKGQYFWDELNGDLYIWSGSAWLPVTITSGEIIYAGTYDASVNQVGSVTSAGSAVGLVIGATLPAASTSNNRYYLVVSDSGNGTGNAPNEPLAPPDMILSNGSTWDLIDVSNAIAGQTASNISFTPYGGISAANVQLALQEVDNEKLNKAGDTMTGELLIGPTGSFKFEGSTDDAYSTELTVVDPTSDHVITLPDVTGAVITTGDTGTVTSTMIADGTIVNADIDASAGIAFSKLASLTSARIIIGNASNVPTSVAVTGDVTISNTGVTAIASGAIVNADINASAEIAVSKLADGAARQLLQTDAAGTGVEWTSDVDIPGTLDVTGAATFDSTVTIGGSAALVASAIGTTVQAYDADTAKLDVIQTFTAVQTLTDPAIIGTILEDVYTISDGAAFEVDPSNGSVQLITLGASRTPKATNFAAGEAVTLMVADGTAYALTWTDTTWGTSGVVWTGGSAPTLATSGYTVIQFWKVGSQVYGATVGDVA